MGAAAALLAAGAAAASAEPPTPVDRPAAAAPPGEAVAPGDVTVRIGFSPSMKEAIRAYYRGKGCPRDAEPPAAGCIPRADPDAPPRYAIGRPLPDGIALAPLPKALAEALNAPEGYEMGLVDGDVVMVDAESKRVTDRYPALAPDAP